jgi:hypothetical protein
MHFYRWNVRMAVTPTHAHLFYICIGNHRNSICSQMRCDVYCILTKAVHWCNKCSSCFLWQVSVSYCFQNLYKAYNCICECT